jgi:hypothetical protein
LGSAFCSVIWVGEFNGGGGQIIGSSNRDMAETSEHAAMAHSTCVATSLALSTELGEFSTLVTCRQAPHRIEFAKFGSPQFMHE